MTTSKRTAVLRLLACCLGMTAIIASASVALATSGLNGRNENYCQTNRDCGRGRYCGSDEKCHDRPRCDDGDDCTVDRYEGRGRCSHTRIDGCTSSRMRLKAPLAMSGRVTLSPARQDVFLQIRSAGTRDILCARVPVSKLSVRKRTFRQWSQLRHAPSVHGLGDVQVTVTRTAG